MATGRIDGLHYSLDGDTVEFFGAKGAKFAEDKWCVNGLPGDIWVQVDSMSLMPRIIDCIAEDVAKGNGDKISQLQLGPRQAVVFYLEGKLTREQLKNSIEGVDFIDIPCVDVAGRVLTVRIQSNAVYSVVTADSEGNIL